MAKTSGPILGTAILQSLDGDTIMCSVNATLTIDNEETETSCKDDGGAYTAVPGRQKWSCQIDGNFIYDNSYGISDIRVLAATKATKRLIFGSLDNPEDPYWAGDCFVANLTENAPNNAVATWSINLSPRGPLSLHNT